MFRSIVVSGLACIVLSNVAQAQTQVFELSIQDHTFEPAELTIPADTKVKLKVMNQDKTAEEFESYDFNREKIIPGNSEAMIFVGPLKAGEYKFFGEFNPKTAQGVLKVE